MAAKEVGLSEKATLARSSELRQKFGFDILIFSSGDINEARKHDLGSKML